MTLYNKVCAIYDTIQGLLSGGRVLVTGLLSLSGDAIPKVANPPTTVAGGVAVADNNSVRIEGPANALVAGARYMVEVWPDVAAGGSMSDVIAGWINSDTSVNGQGQGRRIATGLPVEICPISGKLNLSFMRDSNTAFPCRVYVNRIDA